MSDSSLSSRPSWFSSDKSRSESTPKIEYGLHTVIDKDPLTSGVTDIVAIHGLNGHYEKTWTAEESQYNWLRDALSGSRTTMMVRVMSYAYNAKVKYSKSTADIFDFADQLLESVLAKRESEAEQTRPLVFICHSLGGIIFKQAFNTAQGSSRYKDLAKRFRGVLFFGTPHKGSGIASLGTVMANFLRLSSLGTHTNAQLLRDLERNSSKLEQVSDTFLQLGGSLKIATFYEVERMDMMRSLVVDKDSAIMHMKREVSVSLDRNHRDLCKFSSRSDPMLELVMHRLANIMHVDGDASGQDAKALLLQSLRTSSPESHKARNPPAAPGTCSWILRHPTFEQWIDSPTPGLLWISADPGCGKSVRSSYLIDHFTREHATKRGANISYFFFKSDNIEQSSGLTGLQAILYQILQAQRELLNVAIKVIQDPIQAGNIRVVWKTLVTVLQAPSAKETVCVLDGFDECETSSKRQLTEMLSNHFSPKHETGQPPTKLRVLVSSRPENSLKVAFDRPRLLNPNRSSIHGPERFMIRLRGEDEIDVISRDIGLVIDAEIAEILDMGFPEELLEDFRTQLVARADRTFLWVTLIIQLLKERAEAGASRRELKEILRSQDIYSIYSELLSKRPHVVKARKLLSLVLAATRPLSVAELSIALAVEPEFNTFDEGRRKPGGYSFVDIEDNLVYPFENNIKALCGNFIRVIRNNVYFVHETAREFLLDDDRNDAREQQEDTFRLDDDELTFPHIDDDQLSTTVVNESSLSWRSSFNRTECHALCLEVCVTYIYCMGKATPGHRRGEPSTSTASFLHYAATAWTDHFAHVRDTLHPKYFSYYQNLCHPRFPGFATWLASRTDPTVESNPGGADDNIQDYYVTLFDLEPRNGNEEDGGQRSRKALVPMNALTGILSSNPGDMANHYFPVTTDANGWVALNLDREEDLKNPWLN